MWIQQDLAESCLALCPASLVATVTNLIYTMDLLGFKPLSMSTDLFDVYWTVQLLDN